MANMPKRRKSKDNPYVLDYNNIKEIYTISFIDSKNEIHKIDVSKKVFDAFNKFELEDISQLHKTDKYIDGRTLDDSEYIDAVIYHKTQYYSQSLEDEIEKNILYEKLHEAINELSDIQKRRLKKYFFEDKTFEEIANEEKCTKRAVKFTVDIALEKISKKFQN